MHDHEGHGLCACNAMALEGTQSLSTVPAFSLVTAFDKAVGASSSITVHMTDTQGTAATESVLALVVGLHNGVVHMLLLSLGFSLASSVLISANRRVCGESNLELLGIFLCLDVVAVVGYMTIIQPMTVTVIRLLLRRRHNQTRQRPLMVHMSTLCVLHKVGRVGNILFARCFAEVLLRLMLLHDGRPRRCMDLFPDPHPTRRE